MTLTAEQLCTALEAWAPPALAESYDNVGLLLGSYSQPVQQALLALELTEAVLDEAIEQGCQMIVAHHPIWFGKRTRLTDRDWTGRLMLRAIQQGVAIYAIHTNLDSIHTGVNHLIGSRLGIADMQILQPGPVPGPDGRPAGAGMVGTLPAPLRVEALLARCKAVFGTPCIRWADATQVHTISRVAWCGGSGSFLIPAALQAGAQALITGDVTHHKFFDTEDRMLILDVGHWESEQYTPEILLDYLKGIFPTFAVRISDTCTNPVQYYL